MWWKTYYSLWNILWRYGGGCEGIRRVLFYRDVIGYVAKPTVDMLLSYLNNYYIPSITCIVLQ